MFKVHIHTFRYIPMYVYVNVSNTIICAKSGAARNLGRDSEKIKWQTDHEHIPKHQIITDQVGTNISPKLDLARTSRNPPDSKAFHLLWSRSRCSHPRSCCTGRKWGMMSATGDFPDWRARSTRPRWLCYIRGRFERIHRNCQLQTIPINKTLIDTAPISSQHPMQVRQATRK